MLDKYRIDKKGKKKKNKFSRYWNGLYQLNFKTPTYSNLKHYAHTLKILLMDSPTTTSWIYS